MKKVKNLIESKLFELVEEGTIINQEMSDREITGPYCCDLLSIAMSRAPQGCAWVTVMGNPNTIAVACLVDAACIILAEGTRLDETASVKAKEQGLAVFCTELPVFEAAHSVWRFLQEA